MTCLTVMSLLKLSHPSHAEIRYNTGINFLFEVVFYLRDARTLTLRGVSVIVPDLMTLSHGKVAKVLLEFGAGSNAMDYRGVRPDDVDPSHKKELSDT